MIARLMLTTLTFGTFPVPYDFTKHHTFARKIVLPGDLRCGLKCYWCPMAPGICQCHSGRQRSLFAPCLSTAHVQEELDLVQPAVELSWRDPERLVPATDTPASAATATPGAAGTLRGMMRAFNGDQIQTIEQQTVRAAAGDVAMACEDELSLGGALVRACFLCMHVLASSACTTAQASQI